MIAQDSNLAGVSGIRAVVSTVALVLCGAVYLPGSASAADSVDDLVAEAKAAAAKGDADEAAAAFGKAVAVAHKRGDLSAECDAGEALEDFLSSAPSAAARDTTGEPSATAVPAQTQRLTALVIEELDAKRLGAAVSAHVLARRLLESAAEHGTDQGVKVAAKVLKPMRRNKKAGEAAIVLSDFAEGMEARADEDPGAALSALRPALTGAAEYGWKRLATMIGTEAAVQALAIDDTDAARDALQTVATAVGTKDVPEAFEWRRLVERRLDGAPEDVLAPVVALLGPVGGPRSVSAAGGRGGRGGRGGAGGAGGGSRPMSAIARMIDKAKRGAVVVAVERTDAGLEVSPRPDGDEPHVHVPEGGGTAFWTEGGLELGFRDAAVSLSFVDLAGGRGGTGGSTAPSPSRAFYLLAPGESWQLHESGKISIKRARR